MIPVGSVKRVLARLVVPASSELSAETRVALPQPMRISFVQ